MPSDPKVFFHGGIYLITTSVEEDFMFPPNPLVNELIRKCMAQAQALHSITICHHTLMTTHCHMLARIIDPQDAADFMERFKTESAHAINRLLGRKKRTVWCEGYDSPLLDHFDTIKKKIAYIYENPCKDGLVSSADLHPGVSTWRDFKNLTPRSSSKKRYETRYIPRDAFQKLPDRELREADYERFRRKLIHGRKKNFFEVDMNDWMNRFGITDPEEQHEVNQSIIADVREREAKHCAIREEEGKSFLGRKKVVETRVGAQYQPEREGCKMLTHCEDKEFRVETIGWMKRLIAKGREVQELWRQGDFSVPYPLGLFPPSGGRLAEPIGW